MKIAVVGTGYVGLVTGACFAEMGNTVTCVDKDAAKVERMRRGECPIFEIGLPEMLPPNIAEGRLKFTTSLAEAIKDAEAIFIAVGTNPAADGSADLTHVRAVAVEIGQHLDHRAVIIDKSTVPVGTGDLVRNLISTELEKRGKRIEFAVVSNPEFLKEGCAVEDFMKPDRIIIGAEEAWARELMGALYRSFDPDGDRILYMTVRDAEMSKYAANAMLATKISFINEIATLCEKLGVDVENVRRGIGSDSRIGYSFINPGCGYGGSCFPKDVKALIKMAEETGFDPAVLRAVEERNAHQKRRLNQHIAARFGENLAGMRFGVWGLAFKPGTDDMREAPSKVVIEYLLSKGAQVFAYDPEAMDVARRELPAEWFESGSLKLVDHQYDACRDVDALVLVTEWAPFRSPDFSAMKRLMRQPVIFDGRNQYPLDQVAKAGFEYIGIGRGTMKASKVSLQVA